MQDLRQLPKLRDSLSYLYVEHARIDRHEKSVSFRDATGETPIPCASLSLLMLGPGTTITHAAVAALADNNCLVAWCGEEGVRFYAHGTGGTRSAAALLHQARLVSEESARLEVCKRLYQMRFHEEVDPTLTLEQLRGWEGRRVREAYARAARETGVFWQGRNYDRGVWGVADPVNRALSAANACLYGICHAAILSLGFSPALGFIHTGKQLSFVYDVADVYKTVVTIPTAFRCAAEGSSGVERRTRLACRDTFQQNCLLDRLAEDIPRALGLRREDAEALFAVDADAALPGSLWDPDRASGAEGGVNYGDPHPGAGLPQPAGRADPLAD
ncbi:MAG: type I-E CRISPR-associated endonuclease Cas1 [Armatimonadetes bacterium]|nr:type I-E CRISPR-associated endonuclease Cas1 [Armatimonadota bacterium]